MFYVSFIGSPKEETPIKMLSRNLKEYADVVKSNVLHHIFVELLEWLELTLLSLSDSPVECFELVNTRRFPGGFSLMNQTKTFKCFVRWIVLQ